MNETTANAPEPVTFSPETRQPSTRLFFQLAFDRIQWVTSSLLIGTLALTLTAVFLYPTESRATFPETLSVVNPTAN